MKCTDQLTLFVLQGKEGCFFIPKACPNPSCESLKRYQPPDDAGFHTDRLYTKVMDAKKLEVALSSKWDTQFHEQAHAVQWQGVVSTADNLHVPASNAKVEALSEKESSFGLFCWQPRKTNSTKYQASTDTVNPAM